MEGEKLSKRKVKPKIIYLKNSRGMKAKCHICHTPIKRGVMLPIKGTKKDMAYHPAPFRPVALQPKILNNGVVIDRYIHAECAHISFGELRRAKAEGVSANELLGNVRVVQ